MTYYHITTQSWPNSIILNPRPPQNISFGEPLTPRICVCDDFYKCFLAVGRVLLDQNNNYVKIYKTVSKIDTVHADKIYDYWLTDERWILESCEFKYHNTVFLNNSLKKKLKYFPYIHKTSEKKALDKSEELFDLIQASILY